MIERKLNSYHRIKEEPSDMRSVKTEEITRQIREMCIEANHFLSSDMKEVFDQAVKKEESPLGRQILNQLEENLKIAGEDMIPICQDTGMAVIFIKAGQEVHFEGCISHRLPNIIRTFPYATELFYKFDNCRKANQRK